MGLSPLYEYITRPNASELESSKRRFVMKPATSPGNSVSLLDEILWNLLTFGSSAQVQFFHAGYLHKHRNRANDQTRRAPQPFDDPFLSNSMDKPHPQDTIDVLHEAEVVSLDEELFGFLPSVECYFFGGFDEPGV